MSTMQHRFSNIVVEAPAEWCDTTDDLQGRQHPFTMTKCEGGVGALQFSTAAYKGGELPHATPNELTKMLREFAAQRRLGEPFDEVSQRGGLMIAGASYHTGADFVRVWYVSDGRNFALVTYLCKWVYRQREVSECEGIVHNLHFVTA